MTKAFFLKAAGSIQRCGSGLLLTTLCHAAFLPDTYFGLEARHVMFHIPLAIK